MRTSRLDGDEVERELDKRAEQEPRRVHHRPLHNDDHRERLALKFALVGTEEEARIARGLSPRESQPAIVPTEQPWRPSDGGGS